MTEPIKWTEAILLEALATRFAPPAYAMLSHVPNGTAAHGDRTIDAIAMGLWPSRGLDLHGFEIKVERRDWLRELKAPQKAEGWRFDFFWLVTPLDLVKIPELPSAWGLIEARSTTTGVRLTTTKEAPHYKPKPLTRPMLAAIMRKVHRATVAQDDIERARDERYQRGLEQGTANGEHERNRLATQLQQLRTQVADFERASGVTINAYVGGAQLGQLVQIAQSLEHLRVHGGLEVAERSVQALLSSIQTTRTSIRKVMTDATKTPTTSDRHEVEGRDDEERADTHEGEGDHGAGA